MQCLCVIWKCRYFKWEFCKYICTDMVSVFHSLLYALWPRTPYYSTTIRICTDDVMVCGSEYDRKSMFHAIIVISITFQCNIRHVWEPQRLKGKQDLPTNTHTHTNRHTNTHAHTNTLRDRTNIVQIDWTVNSLEELHCASTERMAGIIRVDSYKSHRHIHQIVR